MMMTMLKELSVTMSDLRYLCVECECGTKVTVDLAGRGVGYLITCPTCNKDFESHLAKDLMALSAAYKNSEIVKYKISFKIPVPSERP